VKLKRPSNPTPESPTLHCKPQNSPMHLYRRRRPLLHLTRRHSPCIPPRRWAMEQPALSRCSRMIQSSSGGTRIESTTPLRVQTACGLPSPAYSLPLLGHIFASLTGLAGDLLAWPCRLTTFWHPVMVKASINGILTLGNENAQQKLAGLQPPGRCTVPVAY
jgi:hypothetical protein